METSTRVIRSNPQSTTVPVSLKEDKLVHIGFLDEPANIAILSSIGGAMILGGVSAAICRILSKSGKANL